MTKEYPLRTGTHVIETGAMKLLEKSLPPDWVLRSVTERDYGLDVLLEIVNDGRMTGSMVAAQVKGTETPITFTAKGTRTFSRLQRSTLNYLLALPTPSFLFVCSTKDKKVYWASLEEDFRSRQTSNSGVVLHNSRDLSQTGRLVLDLTAIRERRWPDIERAITGALMFFNALGPVFLACMRSPAEEPAPSTVQFLLIEHYEFNQLLQRYLCNGPIQPALPKIYQEAIKDGKLTGNGTFTMGFVTDTFRRFISNYRDAIEYCYQLVVKDQTVYWSERHPYLSLHLHAYPPLFNYVDWFARYYWDEYEDETHAISLQLLRDLDDNSYRQLR